MRNKKYWKRAAAWILTAAMVLSSNSFAALAEDGAVVAESAEAAAEAVTEAPEPAAQKAQDVSADAEQSVEDQEAHAADIEAPAADTEVTVVDTEAPAAETEAIAAETEALTDAAEEPAAEDSEAPTEATEEAAAEKEAPAMDTEVLTEAAETETPAEEEELIISDEAGQSADREQYDFGIEPISEGEESAEITKLEFDYLPQFTMFGSGQFYQVKVKATFSDGSVGITNSWVGSSDIYGHNGLCADINDDNWNIKGTVWMSLLKDGERVHDFDGGYGTDEEVIFGEYTLEVYDGNNENMRVSEQITVMPPSDPIGISLDTPVSFSLQQYEEAWYQFQAPETADYCFPLTLSQGNINGMITVYNKDKSGVIIQNGFNSKSGITMQLTKGQTYVFYLYTSIYEEETAKGTFAVTKKKEITGFDFKEEQITLTQNSAVDMLYSGRIPATFSYGDSTYEIAQWSGYGWRDDEEVEIQTYITQQGGDKIGLLLLNSDGNPVSMPYYGDTLEVGEYTLRGYICGETNADERMAKEMKLLVREQATGTIDLQLADPYSDCSSDLSLFTNAPATVQAVKTDLEDGRDYSVEWTVETYGEDQFEEGTYNYMTWEQTDDDTLLLTGHAAEKCSREEARSVSTWVTVNLVCDGETVDSCELSVYTVQPFYGLSWTPDEKREILKNNSIYIGGTLEGLIIDAENDYTYVDTNVTDVSVVGENSGIVSITQGSDEDGEYWDITGNKIGTAVVQVTYEAINPALETESYTFTVEVVDKIYHLDIEDYEKEILTNSTANIATHMWEESNEEPEDEIDYRLEVADVYVDDDSRKVLTTVRVDESDPTKLIIETGDQEEGWVYIEVNALVNGSVVDSEEISIRVLDNFYRLTTDLDGDYNPEIGETLDWDKVGLKLYYCTTAGNTPVEQNVKFEVTDLEGWKIVGDVEEGKLPTLKRVSSGATYILVEAYDDTSDTDEDAYGQYDEVAIRFAGLDHDYNLTLTPSYGQANDVYAFSDQPLTLTLDTSGIPNIDYYVKWSVGYYDEETDEFILLATDTGVWENAGDNAIIVHAQEGYYGKHLTVSADIVYADDGYEYELAYVNKGVMVREAVYDVSISDTCLLNGQIFLADGDTNSAEVYVENSKNLYGTYLTAEIQDIRIEDTSILKDTILREGDYSWRILQGLKEGKTKVIVTLKCEKLWGSENHRFEQEIEVVPYLYRLSAYYEADSGKWATVLYPNDALPISVRLWYETADSYEEMAAGEYSVVYTAEDADLISVTKDGIVTSGSEIGETYVHVAAFVGEKEVASTDLRTVVEMERDGIDFDNNPTFVPGKETLLKPVAKHWSKENRAGEPLPGNWTYSITEMDSLLTKGKTDLSMVLSKDAEVGSRVFIRVEAVNEQGKKVESGWSFEVYDDSEQHTWDDGEVTKAPTCTEKGVKTFTCDCGAMRTEEIPALGHAWDNGTVTTAATCGKAGVKTFKCKNGCGETKTEAIPALTHAWDNGTVTTAATCAKAGVKTFKCKNGCGETKTEAIPKLTTHSYGKGVTVSEATVFAKEKQKKTCSVCGATQTVEVGSTLKPVLKVTATSLKMKQKQSTTKFKVTEMAAGDSLQSVVSSNTKIVKVSSVKAGGTFKLTAQKKKGSAKITITLKSGEKKTVTVKVQSAKVTTSKISGVPKKATLKVKKKLTLKPVLAPVTSQDKITYTSSNKKVATVSSKGVVTAKKAGTVKITVKSGKKKVSCTVKVTK